MKALIVGASRGIGLELVRQYIAAGASVTATVRDAGVSTAPRELGARVIELDVAKAESAARLAWQLDGSAFDVVVYCPGIFGPRQATPEPPSEVDFDSVMHANVLGAMRVLPQLGEVLAADARLAVISSRMGAIGSRASNSGWLYRASKAALNSVLKDMSIALSGQAICVSLHPGWVRTDMGGGAADLDVAQSVAGIRGVIAALTADDNGRFLNHDGVAIDW